MNKERHYGRTWTRHGVSSDGEDENVDIFRGKRAHCPGSCVLIHYASYHEQSALGSNLLIKAKRLDECGRSDQKLELRVLLCCVTESQSGLRLSHTARSDSQFKLLVGSATFIQHAHFKEIKVIFSFQPDFPELEANHS